MEGQGRARYFEGFLHHCRRQAGLADDHQSAEHLQAQRVRQELRETKEIQAQRVRKELRETKEIQAQQVRKEPRETKEIRAQRVRKEIRGQRAQQGLHLLRKDFLFRVRHHPFLVAR